MRDWSPTWLTAVAADYAARGVIDDALVQAATAAEAGLVRVEASGRVWWSDETYRLHGRPRWRRVRSLDDLTWGLSHDDAGAVRDTYAAALSDPDVDVRYTARGENGEGRDLVLRALDLGLALVHRSGADADRSRGGAAVIVDVRDRDQHVDEQPLDVATEDASGEDRPDDALLDEPPAQEQTTDEDAPEVTTAHASAPDDAAASPAFPHGSDLAAAVLSATPDLVLVYDTAEQRVTRMAGNDDDARTVIEHLRHGGSLSEDVHPDDLAPFTAWRDRLTVLEEGATSSLDIRLRRGEDWRWMEVRASDFHHAADGTTSQVLLIVRDIDDRIGSVARVAESERAFREVFDASPVGLAVLDDQGRFTTVNDAFCQLVGHTRDAVLATVYEALLHPEDRAAAVISRARRITEGTAALTSSERRLTRGDGSMIWVRVRTSDIDYNGDVRTLVSVEDVTASKVTEDRLRHDALHDELTGLPNRRLITDRLQLALSRARRTGARLAVFFIDLDDLKRVNDTHPWQHRAGDVLLTSTASAVRETLREADSLGRLGGDEFVAVCEDVGDDETIAEIGERILAAVRRPLTIGSETLTVGASIGVAVTDEDGETAEHLLRRADAAMYIAKAGGGSRVARADTGPLDIAADLDLVAALARNELRLHYRPVVSLTTGAVLGVTTVVRWRHPERGLIPASELRAAISAGAASLPVVHWCLERAISDVRTVAPGRVEHVSVWMSVPGRAALAASTRSAILDAIGGPDGSASADSAPSIVLDVHEGDVASLTRHNAQNRHLAELLDLGPIALGVEGFTADLVPVGTLQLVGAASVSFDPGLLAAAAENASSEQLVRALVSAAAALGVVTVAMDVVSQQQLDLVRSLGIHAAYGDLIGPAAPLDTYADLLHGGRMRLPESPVTEVAASVVHLDDAYAVPDPATPDVTLLDEDDFLAEAGLLPGTAETPVDGLTETSRADDLDELGVLERLDADGPTDAQIWARLLGPHPADRRGLDLDLDMDMDDDDLEGTHGGPAPMPPPWSARNPAPRAAMPSTPELATPPTAERPTLSAAEPEPAQSEPTQPEPTAPAPQAATRPLDIADLVARELGVTLPAVIDVREVATRGIDADGLPTAPPLFLHSDRPRPHQP